MLNCFDALITLDNACASTPGVVALSTLGIDETLIAQFTGPEDTPEQLLRQAEGYARGVMHNDVLTWMAPRIIRRTFVDRAAIGVPDWDRVQQSGTGRGGIVVEIDNPRSNAILRIGSLGMWVPASGPVSIDVMDLLDGTIVATHTIDAIAGENVVNGVQIVLPAHRQRKAYFIHTQEADWYKVDISAGSCVHCVRGNLGGGVHVWGGRLPNAVPSTKSNVQRVSHTSGLSATITVECDHAQMLCEIKDIMAMPYALKVAETIIRRGVHRAERMNSHRLNLDLLKERANGYGEEYASMMGNILGKMSLPNDPTCFACNDPVRYSVTIP